MFKTEKPAFMKVQAKHIRSGQTEKPNEKNIPREVKFVEEQVKNVEKPNQL